MKIKSKLFFILLFSISIALLLYTGVKTYTSYESTVEDDINVEIAKWNIIVDGENITSDTKSMSVGNIVWTSLHTREGKVAPGSTGTAKVEIIPDTDVSIEYRISYIDHTIDPNIVLTVKSISLSGVSYTKDSPNSFTGIIPIEQINLGNKMILDIEVEWVNDENNNDTDTNLSINGATANYLSLTLDAKQYIE